MRPIEFSKKVLSRSADGALRTAKMPWQFGYNVFSALLEMRNQNIEDSEHRNMLAVGLTEVRELLQQPHAQVNRRMVNESEVYEVTVHESLKISFYFHRLKKGFKVHIDEETIGDYEKKSLRWYGPIFLAPTLRTVRPYQNGSYDFASKELSQSQMVDILELIRDVFVVVAA